MAAAAPRGACSAGAPEAQPGSRNRTGGRPAARGTSGASRCGRLRRWRAAAAAGSWPGPAGGRARARSGERAAMHASPEPAHLQRLHDVGGMRHVQAREAGVAVVGALAERHDHSSSSIGCMQRIASQAARAQLRVGGGRRDSRGDAAAALAPKRSSNSPACDQENERGLRQARHCPHQIRGPHAERSRRNPHKSAEGGVGISPDARSRAIDSRGPPFLRFASAPGAKTPHRGRTMRAQLARLLLAAGRARAAAVAGQLGHPVAARAAAAPSISGLMQPFTRGLASSPAEYQTQVCRRCSLASPSLARFPLR